MNSNDIRDFATIILKLADKAEKYDEIVSGGKDDVIILSKAKLRQLIKYNSCDFNTLLDEPFVTPYVRIGGKLEASHIVKAEHYRMIEEAPFEHQERLKNEIVEQIIKQIGGKHL